MEGTKQTGFDNIGGATAQAIEETHSELFGKPSPHETPQRQAMLEEKHPVKKSYDTRNNLGTKPQRIFSAVAEVAGYKEKRRFSTDTNFTQNIYTTVNGKRTLIFVVTGSVFAEPGILVTRADTGEVVTSYSPSEGYKVYAHHPEVEEESAENSEDWLEEDGETEADQDFLSDEE